MSQVKQDQNFDPETPLQEPILDELILTQIIYIALRYGTIFVLVAHVSRYRRTRHIVSLLAVIGASLSFFGNILDFFIMATTVGVCDLMFVIGVRYALTHLSTGFMFFHLLFKARLVYIPTGMRQWTPLQLFSAFFASLPPIMAIILTVTSTPTVSEDPSLGNDRTPSCRVAFIPELSISLSVILVVNNVLTTWLFLNGIVQSLILTLDPLPFFSRAQALLWIVLLGSNGLQRLQKKHWKNQPGRLITSQNRQGASRSSSTFVSDSQQTLVLLVRRVFIAMAASSVVTIVFYTLSHVYLGLIWVSLYHFEPVLSWVFTVLASPLPHENPNVQSLPRSDRLGRLNVRKLSAPLSPNSNQTFESAELTELSDLSKVIPGSATPATSFDP